MKALISDIHSNFEALQAVLADIARHPVEAVYCLGDVVGYGPNPRECLDRIMSCSVVLLGNHDQAVLFDPMNFNPVAERATMWTRDQLDRPMPSRAAADTRWEFLAERPMKHRDGDFLLVHGSPRNPLNEYIFPEDIYSEAKMRSIFAQVPRYMFQGHTHVPGVFTESLEFFSPEEIDYQYQLDGRKTLCNVGSVGQPRDGDWRACYVLLDGTTIRYRRVEYDVDATVQKIRAVEELDDFLADRLRGGR
ncbi:MAG TPA: metallophosphoesterase family protein [Gemmataceae bacterium]|jgi:diadenosine tetraphosphatase ApaH/serine/threonine PP2A family protein phosphatase